VLDYHAVDTRVPFVGRVSEMRSLLAFLKRGGALTLVGPGGVGKSRLAHEAIARFVRDRAVESIFVPLAGVIPEAVTGTVMTALSISEEPSRHPMQTLTSRLSDRALILALDNCEHAPDETGALIDALRGLPRVTVLATSQRRLDYTDEPVIEVEPFGRDDGVAFFMARAGLDSRRAGVATLDTVTTIVERLDGLAVALDLAAARLASLSLEQLAEELAELRPYHLRSTRGSEPRHRTIGHVIAWSYSRLDERSKRVFALASLFSNEFDEDDLVSLGEFSGEDVAAALDDLARNSLAISSEYGWRMLLPIRAVATRMLAPTRNRKALDEAFAARMNELALALTAEMRSGKQANAAVTRLQARYADFCAAIAWALKRPQDHLASIDGVLTAMTAIWADGGRFAEGLRWIERLESIAHRLSPEMRGRIYFLGMCVAHAASEYRRMLDYGPQTISAFTIAGDRLGLARAYNALAVASLNAGAIDDATTYVETALHLYEQIGHERGVATALINQGSVFFEAAGNVARARETLRRAVEILEREDPGALCGIALGNLAEVEYTAGDYEGSGVYAERAIECFETSGSLPLIAWQYQTMARCALGQGYVSVAKQQLLAACNLLQRSPQPLYAARLAEVIAHAVLERSPRSAALALAAARRLRTERALLSMGTFAAQVASDEAKLAQRLGPDGAAEASAAVAGWDAERLCGKLADLLSTE